MILITGARGFIGRSLQRALTIRDQPFRAFQGYVGDPVQLRQQLRGADLVIHLAGAESRGRPRRLMGVDVMGTEALLKACQLVGVPRLIYVSRLGASANALFPLLRAKGRAERLIRQSGLRYTILRSASLFGRDDRFLNVIAGLAAWSWPFVWLPAGGHTPFQPLWVEDFVRCLAATVERPDLDGRTLELAGEERLRYAEMTRYVLSAAGLRRWPLGLPPIVCRAIVLPAFGWWRHPPLTRFAVDRFSTPEVVELDAVYRHFGFRPARLAAQTAYLRRGGPGWRLLRPRTSV